MNKLLHVNEGLSSCFTDEILFPSLRPENCLQEPRGSKIKFPSTQYPSNNISSYLPCTQPKVTTCPGQDNPGLTRTYQKDFQRESVLYTCNITIFFDSLSTLQALQNPGQQSGQSVLRSIAYRVHEIETRLNGSYRTQLQWCHGHSKVAGNEIAHYLASQITEAGRVIQEDITTPPLLQAVALPLGFHYSPSLRMRTAVKP